MKHILHQLNVDTKTGKVLVTTSPYDDSLNVESWLLRPTLPSFEGKLVSLTGLLLSGTLIPSESCDHQQLFSMLKSAGDLPKLYATDEVRYSCLAKIVAYNVTIPYFCGNPVDMDVQGKIENIFGKQTDLAIWAEGEIKKRFSHEVLWEA